MHHSDKVTERFVKHLGPRAKDFCKRADEFWGSETPGL
jgi:hypothetical protein